MFNIVVVDGFTLNPGDNPWEPLEKLGALTVYDRTAPERVTQLAADAEIIVTNKCPIPAETIHDLLKLKFIAITATGFNIVDIEAARERGIPVSNVPEYGTDTVAQFTFALLLELCHRIGSHADSVAAGDWTTCPDFCYWLTPQIELTGKKLGLVGFGRIARRVAELGKAFGMEILASGKPGSAPPPGFDGTWLSPDELFAAADIVSLHCPLTSQTERMVNNRLLRRMSRDAFLINTSRGGLINEQDLANALNEGLLAGAAIDVVTEEPVPLDNPLLTASNCLITPHIAWSSLAARRRLMRSTADNIAAFLSGKPVNVVN